MSFFDAQPPWSPPPEPDYRPPEWSQPPDHILPATVALDLVIASRDGFAAWVAAVLVYPTGLLFELAIVRRDRPAPDALRRPWFMQPGEPDGPRFGVGFADGRKAVVGRPVDGPGSRPDIMLSNNGGGGSDRRWTGRMWLWPLPPPGPLTFAFAWPDQGIDEATVDIDAPLLRAAAGRARELWPDDRPGHAAGGGWTGYAPG